MIRLKSLLRNVYPYLIYFYYFQGMNSEITQSINDSIQEALSIEKLKMDDRFLILDISLYF